MPGDGVPIHGGEAGKDRRRRIVVLANNPAVNDSRIIRSAEAAAFAGYDVIVLATAQDGVPREAIRNGVTYKRLPLLRLSGRLSRKAAAAPLATGRAVTRSVSQTSDSMIRRAARAVRRAAVRLVLMTAQSLVETRRYRRIFLKVIEASTPDIIHAHDLATLPAAVEAAASTGARVIYDSHELETHRNLPYGAIDRRIRRIVEGRSIRRADAVVTVCDSIADHLAKEYGIARPKVVMNAPDHIDAAGIDRSLRVDIGLSVDVPLAVYVGRLTSGRGLEQVIAAMEYWPEGHLALIGGGSSIYLAKLHKILETSISSQRVHFADPVPPNDVVAYVSAADVSVVPIQNVCLSYYYCLPNKLIESAFAGLTLAVSDFPELRRFVETAGNGVVMRETDPKDIARAMREAFERRSELKPNRIRLDRIEAIYGWQHQRAVLLELYGLLIGEGESGGNDQQSFDATSTSSSSGLSHALEHEVPEPGERS